MTVSVEPQIRLKPEIVRAVIVAGDSDVRSLTIANLTPLPDTMQISIEGIPVTWFELSASSVNLFPNWDENVELRLRVPNNVNPGVYDARIILVLQQQGLRAEFRLDLEVLAPLNLTARISPQKATGAAPRYEVTVRNNSLSEAAVALELVSENDYCIGTFTPKRLRILPNTRQTFKVRVKLGRKVPSVQRRQAQYFRVRLKPQFLVGQRVIDTAPVDVAGEFNFQSRWYLVQQRPRTTAFLLLCLLIILLWSFVILPWLIQPYLSSYADQIPYQLSSQRWVKIEQNKLALAGGSDTGNPISFLFGAEVRMDEPNQAIKFVLRNPLLPGELRGHAVVDQTSGNLSFQPDDPGQVGTYPWMLAPPTQIFQRLNYHIKRDVLLKEFPQQRMTGTYIEGGALFITIKKCAPNDPACLPF